MIFDIAYISSIVSRIFHTFVTTLSKSTVMLWRFSSAAKIRGRTAATFISLDLLISALRLAKTSLQEEGKTSRKNRTETQWSQFQAMKIFSNAIFGIFQMNVCPELNH